MTTDVIEQTMTEEMQTISNPKKEMSKTILVDKKIKIVWTSMHNCIRVIKLSKALQRTGKYEIHGVASQVSYGTEGFDSFSFYHNTAQFEKLIEVLPADIYIHSNEPNWQANRIRDKKPNAKIILDGHDFDSIRMNALPIDEMRAFSSCDGFLFASKEVEAFIKRLHKEQMDGKPSVALEHYCNEEWHKMPQTPASQRTGLVYEGGMSSPPYKDKVNEFWHLYPVFKQLVEQGNEVHLAPGNIDASSTYANLGAYVYQPQVYPELMKLLRTRKYGLCVFNNPRLDQKQVNLTLTNKHFEYIACGLPVIVCGAPATADWVKKTGEGICFDRLEDIRPEVLDKAYPECKAVVDKIASEYTMEKHIYKLEAMIDSVLRNGIQSD